MSYFTALKNLSIKQIWQNRLNQFWLNISSDNFWSALIIILLPLQTRWWWGSGLEGNDQFTRLGIYATEILIAIWYLSRLGHQTKSFQNTLTGWLNGAYSPSIRIFLITGLLAYYQPVLIDYLAAGVFGYLLWSTKLPPGRLSKLLVISLILPLLIGFYQVVVGEQLASTILGLSDRLANRPGEAVWLLDDQRILRLYGTWPHPNIAGGYLVLTLIALWFERSAWRSLIWPLNLFRSKLKISVWSVVVGVLTLALFLTWSQAAWLALIVFFLVTFVHHWVSNHNRNHTLDHTLDKLQQPKNSIAFLLLLTAVTVGFLYLPIIFAPSLISAPSSLEGRSLMERHAQLSEWQTIVSSPAVFWWGTGIKQYTAYLPDQTKPDWAHQPVHNALLLAVAELGIVRLLLLATSIIIFRKIRNPDLTPFLPLLILGLFDHYLWSLWPGLVIGSLWWRLVKRELAPLTSECQFGTVPPLNQHHSMQLQPLGSHLIVEAASQETTTALGIIIPDTADKNRPERGTIIAVGPGKVLENGSRQMMEVAVGDQVVFKKYSPDEIELKENGVTKKYLVLSADDVMALIK
ncbi:MAG: co-chaperone GroES [Patescibacteria group bacterium]